MGLTAVQDVPLYRTLTLARAYHSRSFRRPYIQLSADRAYHAEPKLFRPPVTAIQRLCPDRKRRTAHSLRSDSELPLRRSGRPINAQIATQCLATRGRIVWRPYRRGPLHSLGRRMVLDYPLNHGRLDR